MDADLDDDFGDPISFPVGAADECKVGFFKQDRFAQTEISEIIEIEELTEALTKLKDDCDALKRELALTKGILVSDFERKLRTQAIELYVRMNEKVSDLERMQEERVNVVRRAFKMQLTDALIQVHSMYDKNFENRMTAARSRQDKNATKKDSRIRELEETVKRNEAVIQMLKVQLSEHIERENTDRTIVLSPDPTPPPPRTPTPPTPIPESPKVSLSEMKAVEEKMRELKMKLRATEEQLESNQAASGNLTAERAELSAALEDARRLSEQLGKDKAALEQRLLELEQEMNAAAGERESLWQKQLEEKVEAARREAANKVRSEFSQLQESERSKFQRLAEERQRLEERLAQEREENRRQMELLKDADSMRRREQTLMAQVARLKAELERSTRTWEKKFAILRQSLHALKDESYIRQAMQRQAAQLHQAAVMYAADVPVGLLPRPLLGGADPDAEEEHVQRKPQQTGDAFSYTLSVPRTAQTLGGGSDEENQIMSDTEENLPADIRPLPSPPARRRTPRPYS